MTKLLVPALVAIALGSAAGCESVPEEASTASDDASVVLQARTPEGAPPSKQVLDDAIAILRQRARALGVGVLVQPEGSDRIVIQFSGRRLTDWELSRLTESGLLELYDLETSLVAPSISADGSPVEHASLYRLLAAVQSQVRPGTADAYYVFGAETQRLVAGPFSTVNGAVRELRAEEGRQLLAVPDGMVVVTCSVSAARCPRGRGAGVRPDRTYYYLFKYDPPAVPQMTGEDLKLWGTGADFDSLTARPTVRIEFTRSGAKKFRKITRAEWRRGRLLNRSQHFAILLDREFKTFPQIDFMDGSLSDGIAGARAQIEGLDSIEEAKTIAIVLQTGALPVLLTTLKADP